MSIATDGTGLRGYIAKGYTPEAIAAALRSAADHFEIRGYGFAFFDDKVTVQFVAQINETVVTIYDYKSSDSDITDMWEGNYEWHVGGRRGDDVVALLNSIGIDSRSAR
ncbi:hypothetical protein CMI37_35645 [Candidatus Pacearchaeota archaeon]|nr:hypothetical protein [Candidatus Pacearchaeota archaeon]|tara:strand:- start:429 stop:755 length:327 start_codon:yes stop_codon:yes gene_type:complete